jgi:predicted O-methyltransferase YrrM
MITGSRCENLGATVDASASATHSRQGGSREIMKWLLQNFGARLRFTFRNPRYALGSLYRELTLADERFLSTITGVSARRTRAFLGEPIHTPDFAARLREADATFRDLEIHSADLYAKKALLQYMAIRAFRPETVVETGVANGVSSAYILLALHKNERGTLHSVGLNDPQYLPVGRPLGWVVPESLKSRWNLLIGDSRSLLPSLLAELGTMDVFIHDSLHTYDHMLWEYRTAFPYLRPGGLLFSDDAAWNAAFPEFCHEVAAKHGRILRGVGFLRKNDRPPTDG